MADEMEQMEARLAAYIDGALPPAQRAEIEAYLKANPTHDRLITELMSVKAAVGTLPREKAPAEVLDTLQAHLERQTLLEGVEDSAHTSRINRWPQLGAVAAMLLLTAGLGLLVYEVLPRGNATGPTLAMLSSSTRPADEEATTDTANDAPAGGVTLGDADGAQPKTADAMRANEATAARPAKAALARRTNQATAANGLKSRPKQAADASAQTAMTQNAAIDAPDAPDAAAIAGTASAPTPADLSENARVLVVGSDDPVLTQNLLVAAMAAEGVTYELATPPATRPGMTDAAMTSMATGATATAGSAFGASLRSAAALAASLRQNGVLPGGAVERSVVLRNLPAARAAGVRASLDRQRPGRQRVLTTVAAPAAAVPPGLPAFDAPPATMPGTQPTQERAAMPSTAPAESERFAMSKAAPATQPAMTATTQPATVPAAASADAGAAAADLVVFIVPTPAGAAASQPVSAPAVPSSPATRPTTLPASDEVP